MVPGFNFTVVHKKGKENSNADALSQLAHMAEAPLLEEDKYAKVWRICLPNPQSMVLEVWSLFHQSDCWGHRGLEGTLDKFLKGFFMLSARQKKCFLTGGCDTCLTK